MLVEDLEALTSGLRQSGTEVAGTLRVTTSASFGRQYISPLLPEFLAPHPAVRLSINLSDQMLDLVSAGFDLAIRIGALEDSSLVARKLATNRRVLCASPDYLRRHGTPQCAGRSGRPRMRAAVRQPGAPGRLAPAATATAARSRCACRAAWRAISARWCAMPRWPGSASPCIRSWHVCDDLRAGRLQALLPDYAIADTGIYAVMPQRRLVPPRVRAFVDFLAARFGDARHGSALWQNSGLVSASDAQSPRSPVVMSHADIRSAARPHPDQPMVDIADYVIDYEIDSQEAYDTARYMLLDSLACAMLAMKFPDCVKHLGPLVPGGEIAGGARVPGTSFELDPAQAAFNIGTQVRWLDFNDTWLAAEWGHPSDNLGTILAVAD